MQDLPQALQDSTIQTAVWPLTSTHIKDQHNHALDGKRWLLQRVLNNKMLEIFIIGVNYYQQFTWSLRNVVEVFCFV